jgi:hypothetical protein
MICLCSSSAALRLCVQLKHCCVQDPADLCTVNVAGQSLTDAVSKDFELFENVVVVNAADNLLGLGKSTA